MFLTVITIGRNSTLEGWNNFFTDGGHVLLLFLFPSLSLSPSNGVCCAYIYLIVEKPAGVAVSYQIFVSIPISFSTVYSYLTNDRNIRHHLVEKISISPSWPNFPFPRLSAGNFNGFVRKKISSRTVSPKKMYLDNPVRNCIIIVSSSIVPFLSVTTTLTTMFVAIPVCKNINTRFIRTYSYNNGRNILRVVPSTYERV